MQKYNLKEATISEAIIMWPAAEKYLLRAVDESADDPQSFIRNLQAKVFAGVNTLWTIGEDSKDPIAYGISFVYTPDGILNVAQIYMASGEDLEAFLQQMDLFIAWCIKRDVHQLEVVGRKGWEKILKPFGFTHNYTSLTRRITEELH